MDQLQALAVKPQVKRQVRRRRTHTSRPYQENLLNMAEARREIVTALKIHRASSRRQQQPKYQRHQDPPLRQPPFAQLQQQQEEPKHVQEAFLDPSRSQPAVDEEASLAHTTMSYAASFANTNNPLRSSPPAHWIAARSYCSPPPILRLPCDITPPELPPTAAMGGLGLDLDQYQYQYQGGLERLVRSLPAQPLGLNLSFQGFGVSVDDGAKEDLLALPLTQPSPAASYSCSPPAVETVTTHACAPSPALSATDAENHSVIDAPAPPAAALVPALDGEMAQQASVGGEMQGVEWSEAAAADMAACWSKIFESVENGQGQHAPRPNAEDVAAAAGLPMEWWWLCGDDAGVGEQAGSVTGGKPSPDVLGRRVHVDDGDGDYSCCYDHEGGRRSNDDGDEVTLPCMDDIGDNTQGWDGEWFSCP